MDWRLVLSACVLSVSSTCNAASLSIANWNIQTLTYPGDPVSVFPGDYRRSEDDYADLRRWRDSVDADVYILQEVTSPAALDAVFPEKEGWTYCISGQYGQAEGLPASPICSASSTPVKPNATKRTQFTAVAVRSTAEVKIASVTDLPDLNVQSKDDGIIRDVRWGLDVTLQSETHTLRILGVHMKSGCFDDFIDKDRWLKNPAATAPMSRACDTLGRQLYPLRQWIEARETAGDVWMVVGDFNRRLDAGSGTSQDEFWRALSGFSPNRDGQDQDVRSDIALYRQPYKTPSVCWKEFSDETTTLARADAYNMLPIEFFLFGEKAKGIVVPHSEKQFAWPSPQPHDPQRLSDHCPSSLTVNLQ